MRKNETADTAARHVKTFGKKHAWKFMRESDAELPYFFLKLNMFMIVFRIGIVRCRSAVMPGTVYAGAGMTDGKGRYLHAVPELRLYFT